MRATFVIGAMMFIVMSVGCQGSSTQPPPDGIETTGEAGDETPGEDVPGRNSDGAVGGQDLAVPEGDGTLMVMLSDPAGEVDSCFGPFNDATVHGSTDVEFATGKVNYFRIRVYLDVPLSGDEEAFFDSLLIHGCFKAGGDTIKIQAIPWGAGRYVLWEGFSDMSCEDLHAAGVAWGVTVKPNETTEVHLHACNME